jgi:hypothetical protein
MGLSKNWENTNRLGLVNYHVSNGNLVICTTPKWTHDVRHGDQELQQDEDPSWIRHGTDEHINACPEFMVLS